MTSDSDPDAIVPAQILGARAMLRWRREDLEKRSGVPAVTLRGFEVLGAESKPETIAKWRKALEAAGVVFISPDEKGGPGVRLKRSRRRD